MTGGLCVPVGSEDLAVALEWARTGRVLVEILDTDAAKVERVRKRIHSTGLYGLVSANRWVSDKLLPYAENLANVVLIEEGGNVPLAPVRDEGRRNDEDSPVFNIVATVRPGDGEVCAEDMTEWEAGTVTSPNNIVFVLCQSDLDLIA